MKNKGTRWTLIIWTIHLELFSLRFLSLLPACLSPNMWSIMSNSFGASLFKKKFLSLLVVTGNYAWLWTEMLDRSFLMISFTAKGKERKG